MLRKSEKSVVLLLQQDHPCREGVRRVTLSPLILGKNYWSAFSILPSMHREILGLQGERCRRLLEINQKNVRNDMVI